MEVSPYRTRMGTNLMSTLVPEWAMHKQTIMRTVCQAGGDRLAYDPHPVAPTAPAEVETTAPQPQAPVVLLPKAVEPVRRMMRQSSTPVTRLTQAANGICAIVARAPASLSSAASSAFT
jgi:hypothetical protein